MVKEKQNALAFLNEAEGYERAEATNERTVQTATTNGRSDVRANGWIDGRTYGWTDGQSDVQN